ncbi:major facilitator superfamily domain-containing protein [Exophiala viscosa]|uniref:Major facilitator superfamily domain-containing protein n=1 Tax=Exophiala viscosa TaxID=2486360 RepID=A0AAN6E1Y5_9EURO|nr:major facilitator superfamily domain-containing protein [Exophiala viscosa]KAI1623948.1 major facilitator superfamily domain-containing protein [Exophiala viscosa]
MTSDEELREKEAPAPVSDDEQLSKDPADEGAALEQVTSKAEVYPTGAKLVSVLLSVYLTIFLVALDRTIIATALPKITDEFNSFGDVGWYNAGFLLPTTALQLFFGRLYTFYSPKWIFISLVVVFEIGSAVCGAAPNSVGFIWGRAVAGLGAGGLFNGAMILMMYAAPMSKRPFYMGLIGAVFGVASVAGPLLGGVFTTKVTWRWCFYINLPIGAIVLVFLFFAIDNTAPALGHLPFKEKFSRIDIPGTLIFVPCVVCLLLALQWGGQTYAWSDGRIIALFVVFGVLLMVFIGIQIWRQEAATVPPRIMKQRTILAGTLYSFFLGSSFMIVIYYLSIWFQAIKGDSAIRSGFSTLPFILSLVVASIFSGTLVMKLGYYNPSILAGATLAPIGAGLVTLFTPTTAHPMWIGCQVIYGFGIGLGLQQTNIAAQAVLPKKDVPTGMSVVFFGQGLGGTISVAIAQNVLDNKLISGLKSLPGNTPINVADLGATDLRNVFSAEQLPAVIKVYNHALIVVFYIGLAYACTAMVPGLFMEWKSTKGPKPVKEKEGTEAPA